MLVDSVSSWVKEIIRIITGSAEEFVFKAILANASVDEMYQQSLYECAAIAASLGAEEGVIGFINTRIDSLVKKGIIISEEAAGLRPRKNTSGGYTVSPVPTDIDVLRLKELAEVSV